MQCPSNTLSVGVIGERLNLNLRQGATFEVKATMKNPDSSFVDLTGCTIVGQIRKTAKDTTITCSFTTAIIEPTTGQYTFGLSAETTAAIPAGDATTDPESQYVYDLELHDSLGRVTPLYYGSVKVFREVTRA